MPTLTGLKVLEIAAIGPVPFAGMMLADMGADIVRVDRPLADGAPEPYAGFDSRGRQSVAVNLKDPAGVEVVLKLVENADVLMEGFRPGVMERLGLGPEVCLARNPRLVFGRMTGWGQTGPLSKAAGHDLNYIALTGALHGMGWPDRPPTPPLNIVGDYGGGGLMLVTGVLAALNERYASGLGQVVDVAMTDGVAALMAPLYAQMAQGQWKDERSANLLDGAAFFYGAYECSCGAFITIGALEPQFYSLFLATCGLSQDQLPAQDDRESWTMMRDTLAALFRSRSRDDWSALMEGTDICFAPVLSMMEAARHPHNLARGTFVEIDGMPHPAPAPRFSRTPSQASRRLARVGEDSREVLASAGFAASEVQTMVDAGAVVSLSAG